MAYEIEQLDDDLQLIVSKALEDAEDFVDGELSPDRTKAWEYYQGMPFGDEEKGRSSVVSRDVADTIRAILPSLIRVFTGSEKVMEFVPEGPEDVMMAEQATDYVNYVFLRDNPGFTVLHAAFKDALIRKTGVIKTWWDDSTEVEIEDYEGLDDDTLMVLEQDDEIEIIEQSSYQDAQAAELIAQQIEQMQAMAAQSGQELPPEALNIPVPELHDVTVRRTRKRGRIRAEAVPPEEILISRGARSFSEAEVVAHRVELTTSDLVAMGYDEDLLEEIGNSDALRSNEERLTRHPEELSSEDADPRQKRILYTEAWMPLDVDGDGLAELRKVCCLGDQYKVVNVEFARFVPLADFCADPEPHRAIGNSVADHVMDIQRIKSSIMRSMLDSLAQSVHPRTAVVEGEVNMDDVLNNEVGGVVRMRRPGMVQPMETPFVGQQAFPVLNYMDRIKEKRTGITDATQGLDAEALQSTTRTAVNATVEAAQQQIELIARIFAETGMKKLYRNLLRLVAQYQDKPRMIRLRNDWVAMDPRSWNSAMDVAVNSSLSTGLRDDRLQMLTAIAEKQEQILQTLGMENPLVTLSQYSYTLQKIIEVGGYKDASQFVNAVPPDFQMPQPEGQGAGGENSPEMLLAQVQREEIQANIQKKQAELELDRMKAEAELQIRRETMLRSDDRERDRLEADTILRAAKEGVDPGPILTLMRRNRQLEQQGHFE